MDEFSCLLVLSIIRCLKGMDCLALLLFLKKIIISSCIVPYYRACPACVCGALLVYVPLSGMWCTISEGLDIPMVVMLFVCYLMIDHITNLMLFIY